MRNKVELSQPFTFSTLLMVASKIPKSVGVDPKLRGDLEHDFRTGLISKFNALNEL